MFSQFYANVSDDRAVGLSSSRTIDTRPLKSSNNELDVYIVIISNIVIKS